MTPPHPSLPQSFIKKKNPYRFVLLEKIFLQNSQHLQVRKIELIARRESKNREYDKKFDLEF